LKEQNIFYVDENWLRGKLGDYLRYKLMISKRGLIRIKKAGSIKVNGKIAYLNQELTTGDRIEFSFGEDPGSENILPEFMELDIVFEDDYLAVVNKKAGIPTHPSRNHYMGTLANGMVYHWMGEKDNITIRPVNRLDKDTSGLVVFAKSSHIQHLMSLETYKSNMKKEYVAIVHGIVEADSGTIDVPIARETQHSVKRVVREDGSKAVTHYRVLRKYSDYSLLSIILETGRTHQIRVHMTHIGHPLLGDELYGGSSEAIQRHALHAYRIVMRHPVSREIIKLTAPVPGDMVSLL
jgi:23S rRNA pseudouridine1911/1915/1917 synthase